MKYHITVAGPAAEAAHTTHMWFRSPRDLVRWCRTVTRTTPLTWHISRLWEEEEAYVGQDPRETGEEFQWRAARLRAGFSLDPD